MSKRKKKQPRYPVKQSLVELKEPGIELAEYLLSALAFLLALWFGF